MICSPKVSIIIPTYNVVKTIGRCLDSVLNQSYLNFELIVVDGMSTDNTPGVLNTYQKRNLNIIREKDKGVYDAMNKGIKASTGEWIYFLGGDDSLYDNQVLHDIFAHEQIESDVDVIYGNVYVPGQHKIVGKEWACEDWVFENVCHQAIFYRRKLFDTFGMYDPQYKVCADYVYNLQLQQAGVRWRYIDRLIANFSGEGISHYMFDRAFHDHKEVLLYRPYAYLPKKDLYRAKQFYIYNEIRFKNFLKGVYELFRMMYYTGLYGFHLRNGAYWVKERIKALVKNF